MALQTPVLHRGADVVVARLACMVESAKDATVQAKRKSRYPLG